MKKTTYALLTLLFLTLNGRAQDTDRKDILPTIRNGKAVYERIYSLDPIKTKDALYLRVSKWIAKGGSNVTVKESLSDRNSGTIIANGSLSIITNKFFSYSNNVHFAIDVTVKDNAYRLLVTNITGQFISASMKDSDRYELDTEYEKLQSGKLSSSNKKLLTEIGIQVNKMSDDLFRYMTQSDTF